MQDSQYKQILLKEHYFTAPQMASLIRRHQDFLKQGGKTTFVQFLLDMGIISRDQHEVLLERLEGTSQSSTKVDSFRAVTDCLKDRGIQTIGNYTIIKKVGSGGMGTVYQARHNTTHQVVALKILNNLEQSDDQAVKRFQKEAQLASQIKHPNIVEVKEFGIDQNIHFLAMEFVEGKSLTDYQPRNVAECISICSQICQALQVLHKKGIIHRDIKTDNILMDISNPQKPVPKLTDFSLAFRDNPMESRITQTGTALGTPYYMSPEQAMGQKAKIDHRTDIYSLGVMLYFVLTQQYPFTANTLHELYAKIMNEQPAPPSSLRRGIRKEMDLIVFKALAKEPIDRYASCEQMDHDLRNYLRGRKPTISSRDSLIQKLRRKGWLTKNNLILGAMSLLLGISFITIISLISSDPVPKTDPNAPIKIPLPPVTPIVTPPNNGTHNPPPNSNNPNHPVSNPPPNSNNPNHPISNPPPNSGNPITNPVPITPANPPVTNPPPVMQRITPIVITPAQEEINVLEIIVQPKPPYSPPSITPVDGINPERAWQLYQAMWKETDASKFWKQVNAWEVEPFDTFRTATTSTSYKTQSLFQAACLIRLQQYAQAWQILEAQPEQSKGIFYYLRCQARAYLGDWDRALDDARQFADMFPNTNMEEASLWYYISWRNPAHTFYHIRIHAKKLRTTEQSTFLALGLYWFAKHEYFGNENLDLLEEITDRLGVPAGFLHRARCLAKQNKTAEAAKYAALAKEKGVPEPLLMYYYQAVSDTNPIALYKNVVQTMPSFTPVYVPLAQLLSSKDKDAEGLIYLEKLQTLQGGLNSDQNLLLGALLSASGKTKQALETWDQAILQIQRNDTSFTPETLLPATAFMRKAIIYTALGNTKQALNAACITLDMGKNIPNAIKIYFSTHEKCKKQYEALESCDWLVPERIYTTKVKTFGDFPITTWKELVLQQHKLQWAEMSSGLKETQANHLARLGFLYNINGNLSEGQKCLEQSLSLHATAQAHYFLGQMYFYHPQRSQLKLMQKALDHYREAMELDPEFHKARYGILRCYAESVVRNADESMFCKVVFAQFDKIMQDHSEYRYHDQFCHHANNLLMTCASLAKNNTPLLQKILKYSYQMYEFNLSNGQHNKEWSLYNCADIQANFLNNPQEALAYYDQAIKMSFVYPYTFWYRGRFLNKLGRQQEALAHYHFAVLLAATKLYDEKLPEIIMEMKALERTIKQP